MFNLKREKKAEEIIKGVQHKAEEIEEGKKSLGEFIKQESDITADKIKNKR